VEYKVPCSLQMLLLYLPWSYMFQGCSKTLQCCETRLFHCFGMLCRPSCISIVQELSFFFGLMKYLGHCIFGWSLMQLYFDNNLVWYFIILGAWGSIVVKALRY
jgi:hypothetical protein